MSDAVRVLRAVWLDATGASYGGPEYRDAVGAEFDRHIARVKAEAWDEGMEAGQRAIILKEYTPDNPYREGCDE